MDDLGVPPWIGIGNPSMYVYIYICHLVLLGRNQSLMIVNFVSSTQGAAVLDETSSLHSFRGYVQDLAFPSASEELICNLKQLVSMASLSSQQGSLNGFSLAPVTRLQFWIPAPAFLELEIIMPIYSINSFPQNQTFAHAHIISVFATVLTLLYLLSSTSTRIPSIFPSFLPLVP